VRGARIAHFAPDVVIWAFRVEVSEVVHDSENLFPVLLLLSTGDSILIQNLLPLGRHARVWASVTSLEK
jgi:hypothetical protein